MQQQRQPIRPGDEFKTGVGHRRVLRPDEFLQDPVLEKLPAFNELAVAEIIAAMRGFKNGLAGGDEELRCDLAVGQAVPDEAEHLELARGEAECAVALPSGFCACSSNTFARR